MAGLRVLTNLALVSLVVVVLIAVAVRYFGIFNGKLDWASEYSRFGIIWVVMLGAAVAFDQGAHVSIDFTDKLPASICRAVRTAGYLCGVSFVIVLAWQGFKLTFATMRQISQMVTRATSRPWSSPATHATAILIQISTPSLSL